PYLPYALAHPARRPDGTATPLHRDPVAPAPGGAGCGGDRRRGGIQPADGVPAGAERDCALCREDRVALVRLQRHFAPHLLPCAAARGPRLALQTRDQMVIEP